MSSPTRFGDKKQNTLETWKQYGQHSKLADLNLNKGCYDTRKNIIQASTQHSDSIG